MIMRSTGKEKADSDERKDNYIRRKAEEDRFSALLSGISNDSIKLPYMLNIYGGAGTGKSTLANRLHKNVNSDFKSIFVDVSDCYDESKVLAKLAQAFKNKELVKKELLKFEILYQYCYGDLSDLDKNIGKDKPTYDLDAESLANKVVEFKDKVIKSIVKVKDGDGKDTKSINVTESLSKLAPLVSSASKVFKIGDIISELTTLYKDYTHFKKLKEILSDIAEKIGNEREIKTALREYFIDGVKNKVKNGYKGIVIFLDNYRVKVNDEITRDATWLTATNNGLLKNIGALWVICGRDTFPWNEIPRQEINLIGLGKEAGFNYIKNKCYYRKGDYELNIDYKEYKAENSEKLKCPELIKKIEVLEKILSICSVRSLQAEGMQSVYLPYKLNLATNHYLKLRDKDQIAEITKEHFADLDTDEEFVGYYFYMDLTDQLLTAFQILSCIETWDEQWIELIKTKFDNYLLSAHYLLKSKTSVEEVGNGIIKLHEAIKEALYKNADNRIKHDIQQFVFNRFLTYNFEESKYDIGEIAIYCGLSLDYIIFLKSEKKEFKAEYKKFNDVFEKIRRHFNNAKYVSPEFIAEFNIILTKIEKIFDIKGEISGKLSSEYIRKCLDLADLYTYIYDAKNARKREKEAISLAKKRLELTLEHMHEKFESHNLLHKCMNAFAYDSSLFWEYGDAAKYGFEGVIEQYKLLKKYIEHLIVSLKDDSINDCLKKVLLAYGENSTILSSEFATEEAESILPYEDLVKSLSILSKKEKEEALKKKLSLLKDILSNLDNLRGNFPWYYLRLEDLVSKLEILVPEDKYEEVKGEYESILTSIGDFKPISYGIKTYLLRKALHDAIDSKEKPYYSARSLQSYHNIAVYCFKSGELEQAYQYGVEACLRRIQTLNRENKDNLTESQSVRLNKELSEVLRKVGLPEYRSNILLEENLSSLESISYLGDYCLHLYHKEKNIEYLHIAKEKLYQVFLTRFVRFGFNNSGTLDAYCRLAGVYYSLREHDVSEKIMENLLKEIKHKNVKIPEIKLKNYKDVQNKMSEKTWKPTDTW